MSHLHIPDGVLPFWLWMTGYLLLAVILSLALRRLKRTDLSKSLSRLGVLTALMVLAMSVEILFYHINLSVLTGIILGPFLGAIAAFLSNFILAFMGHGGLTVIGLNSLIVLFEMAVGWSLFTLILRRVLKNIFWRGFVSTIITLVASTLLAVGIVTLGGADFKRILEGSVILSAAGWFLESLLTGFVVAYLQKIKPEIIKA